MSISISGSSPVSPADPTPPPAAQKASSEPQTAAPSDTSAVPQEIVQLSAAAQSALREATETPAQTAKEAGHGDAQAKRLLAKQAAAKEAASHSIHIVA
jgi:hypothetical protein